MRVSPALGEFHEAVLCPHCLYFLHNPEDPLIKAARLKNTSSRSPASVVNWIQNENSLLKTTPVNNMQSGSVVPDVSWIHKLR